jgi:hypothetical protein
MKTEGDAYVLRDVCILTATICSVPVKARVRCCYSCLGPKFGVISSESDLT